MNKETARIPRITNSGKDLGVLIPQPILSSSDITTTTASPSKLLNPSNRPSTWCAASKKSSDFHVILEFIVII